MNQSQPPALATWMLSHMAPGIDNEALGGDLMEEFRAGRSRGWYWRQVCSAISVGISREFGNRGALMLFALLWSMLAPVWLLLIARLEEHANLNGQFYRMDWPWSTICDLGLLLLANVVFIWAGIVLYLLPDSLSGRGRKLYLLRNGIAASIPTLMMLWVVLIAVPKYFIEVETTNQRMLGPVNSYAITHLDPPQVMRLAPQQEWSAQFGNPIVPAEVNPLSAIADMQQSTILVRLPFLLAVLCALWRITRKRISA